MVGAGPLYYWRIRSFLILCGTDFGTQHLIGFYFNRLLPFFGTYFAKADNLDTEWILDFLGPHRHRQPGADQ